MRKQQKIFIFTFVAMVLCSALPLQSKVQTPTVNGLDAVLNGTVGESYTLNTDLYCQYYDSATRLLHASTMNNSGSTKNTHNATYKTNEASDNNPANGRPTLMEEDWVAIADLDSTYVGKVIPMGSQVILNDTTNYPIVKFTHKDTATESESRTPNTYRVENFFAQSTTDQVWLVAPQLGEYCQVKGYVKANGITDIASTLLASEDSNLSISVHHTTDQKPTQEGMYIFSGIVYKNEDGYFLKATEAPIEIVQAPVIQASTPDKGTYYYTSAQSAQATISCATLGATLQYAITGNQVTDASNITEWLDYTTPVSVAASETETKVLWAKAVKNANSSEVVKHEFNFKKSIKFELVTDPSQILINKQWDEQYEYIITDASGAYVMCQPTNNTCSAEKITTPNGTLDIEEEFSGIFTLDNNNAGDKYLIKYRDSYGYYDNCLVSDEKTSGFQSIGSFYLYNTPETHYKWNIAIDDNGDTKINICYEGWDEWDDWVDIEDNIQFVSTEQGDTNFICSSPYSPSNGIRIYRRYEEPEECKLMYLSYSTNNDFRCGHKYTINHPIYCHYYDESTGRIHASTLGDTGMRNYYNESKKDSLWSDNNPENGLPHLNQEDWVVIEGLDKSFVGKQIEAGFTVLFVKNIEEAPYPLVKIASLKPNATASCPINKFRVLNFNYFYGHEDTQDLWFVVPRPGEYCQVMGYTTPQYIDDKYITLLSNEDFDDRTPRVKVAYNNADQVPAQAGWYLFTGTVKYTAAEYNKPFAGPWSLIATAGPETDTPTQVQQLEHGVHVISKEGAICVLSNDVADIAVYSASGMLVANSHAANASFQVTPGFYIVKVGPYVTKVLVK